MASPAFSPRDEAQFLAACALAQAGRHEAARAAFVELRARLPQPSAALEIHLAAAQRALGDLEGAAGALCAAVAIDPCLHGAHASLARLHAEMGDGESALASIALAERHAPADVGAWRKIGRLYAEYWRWDEAARALDRAVALEPGHAPTENLLAIVKQELGDNPAARGALARAIARSPGDLISAIAERLYLPQVYEDMDDLERWRERYTRGLDELAADPARFASQAAQVFDLNRTNFLLAYQGRDDRELQRKYSAFLGALAGMARPEWREARAPSFDGTRRLRVGFCGSIFRDCTAGRYFERWITGLDRARFERFVYHSAPISDAFTARIAEQADHFATVRGPAAATVARILDDHLDVLVQPEVGMTPLSYVLAALRLAPVQCAGWGHPVTTGGEGVDCYFTCAAMEPADAAVHYVERLVGLPGPGVGYAMPPAAEPIERAKLGLPNGCRLYVCPQSLFKVHPEMDALLAELLAADPGGVLLFFQATGRGITEQFARRMQRALAARGIAPTGQLKFLPRVDGSLFRRVLASADVVVDTLHWSGGNTSLDAIAAGTPLVTLPGRFMRGRQSAAMAALMDLPELVATSAADYLERAVAIASDRERNRELRARIAERRGALFNRPEPVEAFAAALLQLGRGL